MEIIVSPQAPAPVGPYSHAIAHGGLLFLSGQIPLDAESGALVGDSIEAQAEQVLRNLEAVLLTAGSGWDRVLRVTVYMVDLGEFARFNGVYEKALGGAKPARSTVQVAALPLGSRVELDAIAALR